MAVQRGLLTVLDESSSEFARVDMKDGDKFFIAVGEAARALKMYNRMEQFEGQFRELVQILINWSRDHKDKIHTAMLASRDRDLLFFVVQKNVEFDSDLTDALTDLDISIANNKNLELINLEVLAVPYVTPDAYSAFTASETRFSM